MQRHEQVLPDREAIYVSISPTISSHFGCHSGRLVQDRNHAAPEHTITDESRSPDALRSASAGNVMTRRERGLASARGARVSATPRGPRAPAARGACTAP